MSELSKINGWAGKDNPELVESEFNLIKDSGSFKNFSIYGKSQDSKGKKVMLYEVVRKVIGKDTENIPQAIGDCFVAQTKISMADGTEKNIEDISEGEYVLNHMNQPRKVIGLVRKNFTGNLVTFKLKGWNRTITATETHDALFMPYSGYRFKFNGFGKKKVKDYSKGDYLLLPFGIQSFEYQYINFNEKSIKVDENFARFIGLYLAEGGCSKTKTAINGKYNKITFNFNINEELFAEEIIAITKNIFGLEAKKYYHKKKQNVLLVEIHNTELATFVKKLISGNTYYKAIPYFIFNSPLTVKMACIRGWIDGDGHFSKKATRIIGVTSSDSLLNDLSRLCLSCNLNPMTLKRKKSPHQTVAAGQMDLYGFDALSLGANEISKPKTLKIHKTPFGFARKIIDINKEHVTNFPVFCITVEGEHTLIANGIAQYNCVSWGARNAVEYLMATEKLMKGDHEKFEPVFAPYLYGTGRVLIGRGQLNGQDGSLGSWMADAVIKYGVLRSNFDGVPKYSGSIAKKWGDTPGPDRKFIDEGTKHPVKSAAQIKSWDQLVEAIVNGYPCTTASDIGYDMQPSSDGFHRQTDNWGHQMCFIGVDDRPTDPYAIILNSWGDAHGHLKDFNDGSSLPIGVLRVRKKDAEKHLRAGETFAYSNFDGFPEQLIDKKLFMLI
jgi:intein/homing endonuclease